MPSATASLHVDDEGGQAERLLLDLVGRRRAREQEHQVGVEGARRPDLLAVHEPAAVDLCRRRLDRRRVRPGRRLRDAERLQPQLARGDLRKVVLFLGVGAVAQDRAHRVHLRMAGARVTPGRVDLLQDHARGRDRQPGAAVLLRDQGGEPAVLGQRRDERLGIAVGLERTPVLAGELLAQLPDGGADLTQLRRRGEVHR